MAAFPEPPRLDGWDDKTKWVLQRWMSDLKRWVQGGGGTGTVTSITATLPAVVTPSPLTTVGVVSVNDMTGDSGAGGLRGTAPAPAAGDAAAGKFLSAAATWAVPASSGAPVDATYVVISLNGTLTNERRLQVTGAATLTDGGANADATIDVPGAGSAGSQFNWGKFIAGQSMWPFG